MRKTVLALILAMGAVLAFHVPAAALDGFDLGDMPPLPPPLAEGDAPPPAPPVAPPPLMQSGTTSSAGLAPLAPPPVAGSFSVAPEATPAPPPLLPPQTPPPPSPQGADAFFSTGEPAAAPAIVQAPATQLAAVPEEPKPGKITGGRVNVRAGPNTQYESIAVLTTGHPITVLAKHGEWYKIVFPADQLASIHKNMVDADITGEIPEAGLPGVVNQDNADVHAFYWDRSTVVGKLNKGAPVVIKQERGQWYRIEPPATARAYVFAQYVRIDGGAQVVADSSPPPVNEAVDLEGVKAGEVKLSENDKRANALKDAYFQRLRSQYEADIEAERAAAKAAEEKNRVQAEQLDLALKDLDSRLNAIDEETTQRLSYFTQAAAPVTLMSVGSAAWAPPDPVGGGYTGWVENIGRVGAAPSAYRLTKGGEIRFYLRSQDYNLDEFTNRRVWVNGPIEPAGGASASVLNAEQIRILSELEIAEGMRQTPGNAGAQQGTAVYAAPTTTTYGTDPYATTYGGTYGGTDPYATTYGGTDPYSTSYTYDTSSYGATTTYDTSGSVAGNYMDYSTYTSGAYVSQPSYGGSGIYVAQPEGTADLASPYSGGQTYSTSSSTSSVDPFTGTYSSTTTYNTTTYGAATPVYAAPATTYPVPTPSAPSSGFTPNDPSQLPDIVDSGTRFSAGAPQPGMGSFQAPPPIRHMGEVGTDVYESPAIVEIPPQ